MTGKVLLVDDAAEVREALGQTLELGGYQPILAGSFVAAKDYLNAEFEGVIVSDIRMPGKDGFELLAFSQAKDKDLPVILLTGEGDVPMAVRGMTLGAFDFLEKPCEPKHLLGVVAKAMAHRMLVVENRKLKAQLAEAQQEKVGFLGRSKAAAQIREVIRLAGRVSTPVLICGASGTGRGHVARLINGLRSREGALRQIDCLGPIDWTQIASALRQGAVVFAEIEHLSAADQSQLARLLGENNQDSVYATASDTLEAQMQAGNFSDALFYALAVVRIDVPPCLTGPRMLRYCLTNSCVRKSRPVLMSRHWTARRRRAVLIVLIGRAICAPSAITPKRWLGALTLRRITA